MIAGVVIVYNPDHLVIGNISTYVDFLDTLYVLDNSELYNQNVIDFCQTKKNVVYINNKGNLGVAKALNVACKRAHTEKHRWILTMDQDSYINNDSFFTKISALIKKGNIGIIAASYVQSYFKPVATAFNDFVEVETIITSGNLLNLMCWEEIGRFNEKLFIDEVDNEFCIRLINSGYKIMASTDIYLEHNLGTKYQVKNIITGKEFSLTRHSPFRVYYMTRNNLYLWKRYIFTNPALVFNRIKNLTKLTYEITFYYPDKLNYYRNIFKGVFHFFASKYD